MKVVYNKLPASYVEMEQKNPLRWVAMKKVKETFTNTTNVFKCKDYFNDFVVYRHCKKNFEQYGMKSNLAKYTRKGGMWVMLCNVTQELKGNIERCINTELGEKWGIKLEYLPIADADLQADDYFYYHFKRSTPNNYALLYIPKEALTNTYRISLVTLLIRNCNVDKVLNGWDDLIQPSIAYDGGLDDARYTMLKERTYAYKGEKDYVYFCTSSYNSKIGEWCSWMQSSVHNSGFMGFSTYFVETNQIKGHDRFSISGDGCEDADDEIWDEETDDEGMVL